MIGVGRVIEVLENGRVHASIGREQMRDLIVMHPAAMRINIAVGQRVAVFEPMGSQTERYAMPIAFHGDAFGDGPGTLVALQTQVEHLQSLATDHIHPDPATGYTGPGLLPPAPPGTPIPDLPEGAENVKVT